MNYMIKRDGRKEKFRRVKVENAIYKAFEDVDGEITEFAKEKASNIATFIENKFIENDRDIDIEEIQDMVETGLMATKRKDVAKSYILYRQERTAIREGKLEWVVLAGKKLEGHTNDKANANVDEDSFGGRMGEANNVLSSNYALKYMISKKVVYNHIKNRIYIHDLASWAVGCHNCLSIPFDHVLAVGFKTKQTDVRGAQSVNTAFQLVAVIFQLQSLQQFGGCSATHLDHTMVPYVRKSFFKHYVVAYLKSLDEFENLDLLDMIFDDYTEECIINNTNIKIERNRFDIWVDDHKSEFLEKFNLKEEDFFLDNKENLDPKLYQAALYDTLIELKQAVEGMYHNLNTLQSRSGNQLPFTSINYGTCTSTEGRLVIKALLEGSIKGVGALRKTSIFPCGIFQCMKGVNRKPGDPNYDLFKLAIKSTSKRLYPNYVNVDWSCNSGYDIDNPSTYTSTMGCVDGGEIITYKLNGVLYVESFARVWERLGALFTIKEQYNIPNNPNLYIDLVNVEIYDTNIGGFTPCYRLIRNISNKWIDVTISGGRKLLCTADHPFEILNKGVVFAENLEIGDKVLTNRYQYSENNINMDPELAWTLGVIICDGCYNSTIVLSLAAKGEDDIEARYISNMEKYFGVGVESILRERGVKGTYKDIVSRKDISIPNAVPELRKYLHTEFEGEQKIYRHFPSSVFSWNYPAKLAFLAGMIDADGYINNSNCPAVVQIGSTNKELALQQMALAQSLGMTARIYENHYSADHPEKIRYRIEFVASADLVSYISCQKKIDKYSNKPIQFLSNNNIGYIDPVSEITNIKYVDKVDYSYDVTTASEHFEVSGIYSHNCRTYNGFDINGLGQLKDGRGNIAPSTIIMPTLAMEAKEASEEKGTDIVEEFMNILDIAIHDCRDGLIERYKHICSQSVNAGKFMYENGLIAGYIPEEGIESALKHGTLAIGNLGLAETLQILIGCNQLDPKGMELGERIYKLFNKRCKEFKEEYKLNFGVYNTPAENLVYTAMNKFKAQYGEIPNVSEHKFFTNSMHIPVWEEIDPFTKIDIEAKLGNYSNAGCILYIELDADTTNNLEAIETYINYAMDHDVPYFAINIPKDTCLSCGYSGEFNDVCPCCGSDNIEQLRRVTGYLNPDYRKAFNAGKQEEVSLRYKHTLKLSQYDDMVNRMV